MINQNIISHDIYQSHEYGNDFPALDIKFHNSGARNDLITEIRLEVLDLAVNKSPVLEYSLECRNGDLIAVVYNYGWGDAYDFSAKIDISQFEGALRCQAEKIVGPSQIEQSNLDNHGHFTSNTYVLVEKGDIDPAKLPNWLIPPNKEVLHDSPEFWKLQHQIAEGGVQEMSLNATYKEDQHGKCLQEEMALRRIQRGAYDWRCIYYSEDGFMYLPYDGGVRYSLIFPSCAYNFILDPDSSDREIVQSVAHEVPADGFERVWIVVGAKKSIDCRIRISLSTHDGTIIKTPDIVLKIWNPRNTFQSLEGRHVRTELKVPENARTRPYNPIELQQHRTHSWGY